MINVYTDGSFRPISENEELQDIAIVAGCGIVIQYIDDSYGEIVREEYHAIRYNKYDLAEKIKNNEGYFECFSSITSTLIECLGFIEGVTLLKDIINNRNETIHFHCDDTLLVSMFNEYSKLIKSGNLDVSSSPHYGCYMCTLDSLFKTDYHLLDNIIVSHVTAHKDNEYNNLADFLASYSSNPNNRIATALAKNTDFSEVKDKKEYFTNLRNILGISKSNKI